MIAFLNKHPWLYLVLIFTALIAAWITLITVAVKNQPEEIPHPKPPQAESTKH